MISQVSEKTMHIFQWGLAIGWLVLIVSLATSSITDCTPITLIITSESIGFFKKLPNNSESEKS